MLNLINIVSFLGKGEAFPILFSDNILLITLLIPLLSIFIIFFTSSLGNSYIYKFSLASTVISFLMSLLL
jgi:hypothetical protein